MGSPVWALAGVGQDSAVKVARGSSLESSGRDLCPRSGPGSLLPYVPQSQVPRAPEVPAEIERLVRIMDETVRVMVVRR